MSSKALIFGVAALMGGVIGTFVAMRGIRSRGLSDPALAWYEESRRVLAEFQLIASRAARMYEDDGEISEELHDEVRATAEHLVGVLAGAEVHCPQGTCERLRSLVVDIYMIAGTDEAENPWSHMAEHAHITATVLANEARSSQRMEELPGNWEGIRTPVRPLWGFPERT